MTPLNRAAWVLLATTVHTPLGAGCSSPADATSGGDSPTSVTSSETVSPETTTDTVESSSASADASSTTGEPAGCQPDGVFGLPVKVLGLNTDASETRAWFSSDELTVFVASARGENGDFDVFNGLRDELDLPFGTLTPLSGLNTSIYEAQPALTDDGLTIFCAFGFPSDIGVASRKNVDSEFGALEAVAVINDANVPDSDPWISADASVLYFNSYRLGGINSDLFRTARQPNGSYTPPVEIAELNTTDHERAPVLSNDLLTIFFDANRGGGDFDIWVATRSTADDGFGEAEKVAELNSEGNDSPVWLSPDGCRLYISSNRGRGPGSDDVYVAERSS